MVTILEKVCRMMVGLLVLMSVATAQGGRRAPVPIWPGDVNARQDKNQYVFVTPEKDAAIVLVPKQGSGASLKGELKVVRVPLRNHQDPRVSLSVVEILAGLYGYRYTIANGPRAKDPIGQWSIVIAPTRKRLPVTHEVADGDVPWAGTSISGIPVEQAELPGAPAGNSVLWIRRTGHSEIAPGSQLGGFEIETKCRPGFTTAYFAVQAGPRFEQWWPREVLAQLFYVADWRFWMQTTALTIGPIFRPETSRQEMIWNFRTGLDRLVKTGRIPRDSAFLSGVRASLDGIERAGVSPGTVPSVLRPTTQIEREIVQALKLSLSYQPPPKQDQWKASLAVTHVRIVSGERARVVRKVTGPAALPTAVNEGSESRNRSTGMPGVSARELIRRRGLSRRAG